MIPGAASVWAGEGAKQAWSNKLGSENLTGYREFISYLSSNDTCEWTAEILCCRSLNASPIPPQKSPIQNHMSFAFWEYSTSKELMFTEHVRWWTLVYMQCHPITKPQSLSQFPRLSNVANISQVVTEPGTGPGEFNPTSSLSPHWKYFHMKN